MFNTVVANRQDQLAAIEAIANRDITYQNVEVVLMFTEASAEVLAVSPTALVITVITHVDGVAIDNGVSFTRHNAHDLTSAGRDVADRAIKAYRADRDSKIASTPLTVAEFNALDPYTQAVHREVYAERLTHYRRVTAYSYSYCGDMATRDADRAARVYAATGERDEPAAACPVHGSDCAIWAEIHEGAHA